MAVSIKINPAVLKWVMDNEGWNADELARETGISASQIRRWTSIESGIDIGDIRKIAAAFRRSMSALFMDEAPAVGVPSRRQAGGGGGGARRLSRGALDVVREARYVQGNAADMLHAAGKSARSTAPIATTGQGPEPAAVRIAKILGICPPRRTGSGKGRDMQRYADIREKIESQGVLTMQAAIPAEDGVSGLALAEPAPAVILANSRDRVRRRIFTLLHEYAHVALRDAGVACAVDDSPGGGCAAGGGARDIERWCNRFAGAVLMPRPEFSVALRDAYKGGGPLRVVAALSDRFCVDKAAALERILDVLDGGGTAAATAYSQCRGQVGSGGGGEEDARAPRAAECMVRRGRRYARMVLDAEKSGIITTNTALEYLGAKLGDLDDLRAGCGAG